MTALCVQHFTMLSAFRGVVQMIFWPLHATLLLSVPVELTSRATLHANSSEGSHPTAITATGRLSSFLIA
jgi:hypothetical protein